MDPIPIQVQCYAGRKADESPRRFLCQTSDIEVEEILDQWLTAGKDPTQPPADYFKVHGNDGHDYLLRHQQDTEAWFVVNRW